MTSGSKRKREGLERETERERRISGGSRERNH